MIVPMKRLALLCLARDSEKALRALRDLGVVHVDLSGAAGAPFAAARKELADAETAVRLLAKAAGECAAPAAGFVELSVAEVLAADAERRTILDEADALRRLVRKYAPYGDFDPALARKLLDLGIDLSSVAELPDPLPPERLSALESRLAERLAAADAITARMAAANREVGRIIAKWPELQNLVAFRAAEEKLVGEGPVAALEGWVPETDVPALRARAVANCWGVALRDPAEGETPPTLIRPPKLFRPVKALFDGLGIAPAYVEADVSVPFLCYFALFFAMLVGDGGYGALLLALTLWGWRRTKPAEGHRPRLLRSWLTLSTVFSFCTIVWGVLSNTWFGASLPGIDADAHTGLVRALAGAYNAVFNGAAAAWLGDPTYSNMMLLCFTIGVSHLVIARLWSGVCLWGDRTCLAQFGWAGILLFMYLVTNAIVGIFPGVPPWAFWTFGVSLALVFGFTLKGSELKSRGIELGMLPLNVMSALGDIISYVRLFAVGLASVKVAENFNAMAIGLVDASNAWWINALMSVALVLILLIGHGLNLAMAGLSILVHAVRLNTLEFSNHKGISWSGYAFSPFRKH